MIQRDNELFWLSSNLLQRSGQRYSSKILGYNPIAYWPLWEASGDVAECLVNPAQNGTYTGGLLGEPGIGDGNTSLFIDGVNDLVDVGSVTFNAAFNGLEGSMMIWLKAFNAGVWTDTGNRYFAVMQNAGEYVILHKNDPNQIRGATLMGGNAKDVSTVAYAGSTAWINFTLTWSDSGNALIMYTQGANPITSTLGTWGGGGLTSAILGAGSAAFRVWHGWLQHCFILGYAATPAQIADLAVI